MIPVTKPFLSPIEEYQEMLQGIWERNWLTNNGPLVNELELSLKEYLDVPHLLFLSNGTLALQIAIKALGIEGEVITTPFSYVATTSSIVWEGCKPVFVDIDANTLNIDPGKIEEAITPQTTAILATHTYGNPCDVEAIAAIAEKHHLKVIYDAAHCFGTKYKGSSIFKWGDVSTTSFHATKLFHTIEGGAVFCQDADLLKRMAYMRNFGHDGFEHFSCVGINAKNSEFHAAMGLVNLRYVDQVMAKRKQQCEYYDQKLAVLPMRKPAEPDHCDLNFIYYPIILESENLMLKIYEELEKNEVFTRRYFYPPLTTLSYVPKTPVPNAEDISRRILCLPLYHTLSQAEQDMIVRIILRTYRYK